MISLDKVYLSEKPKEVYEFEHDERCEKRPSWLKFKDIPSNIQFVKILKEGEAFWYRRYFENYFFPLKSTTKDYEFYYDEIAQVYDKMVPQNKELAKEIIKHLKKLKVDKTTPILEVGAGTGLVTEEVVKEGYNNIVLIDISKNCLALAKKKKALAKCECINADVLNFKTPKKFGVIYNSMSLDYFNEDELSRILKSLREKLISKGYIISIDRHIYKQYKESFGQVDAGSLMVKTKEGDLRYEYFIGQKRAKNSHNL